MHTRNYAGALALCAISLSGWTIDGLIPLEGYSFPVHYSGGREERAQYIAGLMEEANQYFNELLGDTASFSLQVLSEEDWKNHTCNCLVYGMPHYDDETMRLNIAADDNHFWQSFLPPLESLPVELADQVRQTYTTAAGNVSLMAFFDLLGVHELGHAFHFSAGLNMQRKWLQELYVNMLLHTFIAERRPQLLDALMVFPRMVVANPDLPLVYTSLKDVHERYDEIGKEHPVNYGWYQCRWHSGAATIYDEAGPMVCRNLWNALRETKADLDDQQLIVFLEEKGHHSVADLVRNWSR